MSETAYLLYAPISEMSLPAITDNPARLYSRVANPKKDKTAHTRHNMHTLARDVNAANWPMKLS